MAFTSVLIKCFLFLSLAVSGVLPTKIVDGEIQGLALRGSEDTNPYLTIIRGLLQSDKIVRYASDIPCNIIQTLESDAGQAEQFVQQIEDGQVPTLIQDLPDEVVSAFQDVLGIFVTLPTELVGAAEAAVTDAANLFNDIETGAIVSDIENLPGVVLSDVTSAWGDLTSGLEDDWNAATNAIACFFDACPVTSSAADSCGSSTVAVTSDQLASVASEQSLAQASVTGEASFQASLAAQSSFVATVAPAAPLSQASSPIVAPTGTASGGGGNSSMFAGSGSSAGTVSGAAGGSRDPDVIGGISVVHLWGVVVSAVIGLTFWL